MNNVIKPNLESLKIVEKAWGHEEIYVNNYLYCLKKLVFKKNAKFSLHMHFEKKETWICEKGWFILRYKDLENARDFEMDFKKGQIITIPKFLPHQLTAMEISEIWEVSSHHEDSDSYRIEPGDSQKCN